MNDHVVIHTSDGAALSAIVVRRSDAPARIPASLVFTIYVDPGKDLKTLEYAVLRDLAGTRG